MTDIQSALQEFSEQHDNRTSVFEIEVHSVRNNVLKLSGRLLHDSQADELRRLLPDWHVDMSSVRILDRQAHERVHVATNLAGLYEKPTFGMPLSSELTYGIEVEVLDSYQHWAFIRQADGYLGWTYRPYLSNGEAPKVTHLVLAPSVELRAEPDEWSLVLTRLVSGTGVAVEENRDEWSCISASISGWIPSKHLRALSQLPRTVDEKRLALSEDAERMIGVPYLWGGTSGNGIDCSGFARLLHRWIGVQIPRDADMQYTAARPVDAPYEAGDLLFFSEGDGSRRITHVGISLGGWTMIHSSRSNNGVYVDNLQERKPLRDIFAGAGSFLQGD